MLLFVSPSPASSAVFVALVVLTIVLFVGLVARAYPANRKQVALKALAGVFAWCGFSLAYVGSGVIDDKPFLLMPLFLMLNLGAIVFGFSKVGTQVATQSSLALLIGYHCFRFPLELLLHSFADQGTVPPQMTWTGHNLDIASGVLALVIGGGFLLAKRPVPTLLAWLFNVVGSVLLLGVIVIVIFSSPLPLNAYDGPPMELAAHNPYVLIGSVHVASAFAVHVVLWRRLWMDFSARKSSKI